MSGTRIRFATSLIAAALALSLITLPKPTEAALAGVGGSLGYSNPENLDGTAQLGLHADLARPDAQLQLHPNMTYWNVDRVRSVAPNMDVAYQLTRGEGWTPYVGGGMGLNFVRDRRFADRSSTDVGVNVLGGVKFPMASNQWFLEGRYTASDVNQVAVVTGVTFHAP